MSRTTTQQLSLGISMSKTQGYSPKHLKAHVSQSRVTIIYQIAKPNSKIAFVILSTKLPKIIFNQLNRRV